MQKEELIVTRADQARALQNVGFLAQFRNPTSPSEVAKNLDLPANLAHHHAKRYARLELLNEVKRADGRVYYQLAAKVFKHDSTLLPLGSSDEKTAATLTRLKDRFLAVFERSHRAAGEQISDWAVYTFGADATLPPPEGTPLEARPPHFHLRTVPLSPERYRAFVKQVDALLRNAEAEGDNAEPCTFAFVALPGALQHGARDAQELASFMPPEERKLL